MTRPPDILIVDDDASILQVLRFALEKSGFFVAEARNGREALVAIRERRPRLVVLDIHMPELDGIEVCRTLRPDDPLPIVFLSSSDDEIDRVLGLELGGDDYVTKPFSPRELVARVKAVLRRAERSTTTPAAAGDRVRRHGPLAIDEDRLRATWDGVELTFTMTELAILRALMRFPGKVYSRDELIDRAYGPGTYISDRTVDSHLRRVRRKFAAHDVDPIETVHGAGYRLREDL